MLPSFALLLLAQRCVFCPRSLPLLCCAPAAMQGGRQLHGSCPSCTGAGRCPRQRGCGSAGEMHGGVCAGSALQRPGAYMPLRACGCPPTHPLPMCVNSMKAFPRHIHTFPLLHFHPCSCLSCRDCLAPAILMCLISAAAATWQAWTARAPQERRLPCAACCGCMERTPTTTTPLPLPPPPRVSHERAAACPSAGCTAAPSPPLMHRRLLLPAMAATWQAWRASRAALPLPRRCVASHALPAVVAWSARPPQPPLSPCPPRRMRVA